MGNTLNRESYGEFFVCYYNELLAYANTILWDEAKAEDVVQDVFLKCWENRDKMDVRSSLLSYFYISVKNRCYNYLEHVKVERKGMLLMKSEKEEPETEEEPDARRVKILDALDRLPLQCRRVVVLSCIEGMKYDEVAKELGISVNTVRTQVYRAFSALRRHMGARLLLQVLLRSMCAVWLSVYYNI